MSNIDRSDEWKSNQVRVCLSKLLQSNPELYDKILDTTGFAYWFNVLCLLAQHSMWGIEDVENYLRTGSMDRKVWSGEKTRGRDEEKI